MKSVKTFKPDSNFNFIVCYLADANNSGIQRHDLYDISKRVEMVGIIYCVMSVVACWLYSHVLM